LDVIGSIFAYCTNWLRHVEASRDDVSEDTFQRSPNSPWWDAASAPWEDEAVEPDCRVHVRVHDEVKLAVEGVGCLLGAASRRIDSEMLDERSFLELMFDYLQYYIDSHGSTVAAQLAQKRKRYEAGS